MSAIVNAASNRINAATAGVTGAQAHVPTALPASPSEILQYVPTEFGDLTGLFGGGTPGEAAGQYVPVTTGLTVPGGTLRGRLGGVVPDFRNTAQKVQQAIVPAQTTAPAQGAPRVFPGAIEVRSLVTRFRSWAKL